MWFSGLVVYPAYCDQSWLGLDTFAYGELLDRRPMASASVE